MENLAYKGFITSRNGLLVPVFANGALSHSKYDPRREADRLAEKAAPANFFVLSGVGGGYFIEALHRRFPSSVIVGVEGTEKDIDFLLQCPAVKALSADPKIAIVPLEKAADAITRRYIPAWHGALGIVEWEPWARANCMKTSLGVNSLLEQFQDMVGRTRALIAADTSTQAMFGKIWQRNILLNALYAPCTLGKNKITPYGRVAVVAAAGPSLDFCIERIRARRKDLFVIAADTAYSVLAKQGIDCDAVVSIDGQEVSHTHFMSSCKEQAFKRSVNEKNDAAHKLPLPLFVMDLVANPAIVRRLSEAGYCVSFVRTGHPLSAYLAPDLPLLDSGGGTVAIAACDYARQLGFENIAVCGADFAYIDGRPYSRGTYLDGLYSMNAARTNSAETSFCRLMFRAPLIFIDKRRFTTPLLSSYRASFETWMARHGYQRQESSEPWVQYKTTRPVKLNGAQDRRAAINTKSIASWLNEAESEIDKCFNNGKNNASQELTLSLMAALPCAVFFLARNASLDSVSALRLALRLAKNIDYLESGKNCRNIGQEEKGSN